MTEPVADVSVIIPMYNAERFIIEAIESVRSQTVGPREILVVDDGSTDQSVAKVSDYDRTIPCIAQSNAGAASARGAGAQIAKGRFLAFLDADDLWLPEAIELRLAVLNERAGVDAVFGAVQQFLCETTPEPLKKELQIHTGVEQARHPGCMLIRSEAYRGMGGFDPGIREGEMLDFASRFEAAGYVSHMLPDLIFRRRVHGANTVLHAKGREKAYLKALRERLRRQS